MSKAEDSGKQSTVVDLAKQLFSAAGAGASELVYGRTGMQGASELAHALFSGSGSAYVPYGPGQQPAKENEQQHENEGMSR